jgi:alanyl-tRNA synthetase
MTSSDIRRKFIDFFVKREHREIPSASLVPDNDPTTLFTSSGMQPLVPYLLGQSHPAGKRLVNSQKSFRAQDIEEVGDNRHITFFEMLGNWSLGDYFKKEQLPWVFEFLTGELGLDPRRLYVSVFEGNSAVSKDTESAVIWKELFSKVGIDAKEGERIFAYPASKNWWSRSGEPDKMPPGEPGGPDSEVFFDFGPELKLHDNSPFAGQKCHINCDCGRYMEIANSVFMQYVKQPDGSLKELSQKNVDFGGGLDRLAAVVAGTPDIFTTDLFGAIIRIIESQSGKKYGQNQEETRAMRIIGDHIKGAVMMMADGVLPSNKAQGYVLRRLIRRALLYGRSLGLAGDWKYVGGMVDPVAEIYREAYPEVTHKSPEIRQMLEEEAARFGKTLEKGMSEIEKIASLDGKTAFRLYETYGFPREMTEEIALKRGAQIDREEFESEFRRHQDLSRTAAKGMFKGGLADQNEQTTKLHTATHLLHQALRMVLGDHVVQRGSNITAERLRFDFSHPVKMTDEEVKKVEGIVNEKISRDLPVSFVVMDIAAAKKSGAIGVFGDKYSEKVKVYTVGDPDGKFFSREICGGPHVDSTGALKQLTITREESAGAGVRRIYATLLP